MIQMHSLKSLTNYPSLLDSMLKDRKKQFSDRLKWEVSYDQYERETDQYDNELSRYLVFSNNNGRHLASLRLNAGSKNCMLRDHFAPEFPEVLHYNDGTIEVTRFCISPDLGHNARQDFSKSLVRHLFLHCLDIRGIQKIVGLCYPPMMRVYSHINAKPCNYVRGQKDPRLILASWNVTTSEFAKMFRAPNVGENCSKQGKAPKRLTKKGSEAELVSTSA